MRARLLVCFLGLPLLAVVLYAALAAAGVRGPAALALLVTLGAALPLSSLFERRLRRAADFAERLARGESPARLPETAGGVTGDLYRGLNRLAEAQRLAVEKRGAEKTETDLLLREMGEGVLALDSGGRVVRVNPELRSVLGAGEPLAGRAVGTLFREPGLVSFLTSPSVPDEGAQAEFDVFGRTMLVTARRLPAGGMVAVFSDLTELRRLDRVRTEFVANASHELKTPLTAIRGYAETLQDPDVAPGDRSRFADRIVEHAERVAALVEDLLTLARLEDPATTVSQEAVEASRLGEAILEAFAERAQAAGITTHLEIDPPDLSVRGDREGLRQILENLLDNAIRHSRATTVHIRLARTDGEVMLTVSDDGRGIPAADLERIFERFYRVDASRSRATGGTGLGLSIVKHWAEGMGGRVWADSGVGAGTAIHVTFTAAER